MFNVKSVDEVMGIIRRNFWGIELESELVDIRDAGGKIVACDVCSGEDVPQFNRSSVDGYAVMAIDTFGAGEAIPAQLRLLDEIKMGVKPHFSINAGEAAYVPTGGELPEGADAVVMIEYAEELGDGFVYVFKPVAPGNNVVFRGDDVKTGDTVLNPLSRLRPQNTGVLAALGIGTVAVKRRLKVGIISTGDEVVDIRQKPQGSQVRDVNSQVLYSGVVEYGGEPVCYGIVGDSFEMIKEVVDRALEECDIVLVSGGSSVGTRDETYRVIDSIGSPGILVHGIAVKPGKPTIIGKTGSKAVVGLPGHPASAYFIFRLFVCRIMDAMNGLSERPAGTVKARMAVKYPSNNGREEFVPVILEKGEGADFIAHPVFGKSGLITLLASADGYVRIERGSEGINAGDEVAVMMF